MNITYSYNTLVYAGEDITKSVERLAQAGYDYVDFIGEPEKQNIAKIVASLKENHIQASSICALFTQERDLISSTKTIRENTVKYIKDCVDFAVAIGARFISVQVTANMKIRPEADKATELKWAVAGLKEAGQYALEKGIKLTLEAWNRYETYFVNRMEQSLEIVNMVNLPSVGCMADTYHMNIEEDNIADAIRLTGKKLFYVHVADSNRKAPGRGHIDFKAFAQALRDIDYNGTLSMELLPAAADPFMVLEGEGSPEFFDQYTKESIKFLKNLFEEE